MRPSDWIRQFWTMREIGLARTDPNQVYLSLRMDWNDGMTAIEEGDRDEASSLDAVRSRIRLGPSSDSMVKRGPRRRVVVIAGSESWCRSHRDAASGAERILYCVPSATLTALGVVNATADWDPKVDGQLPFIDEFLGPWEPQAREQSPSTGGTSRPSVGSFVAGVVAGAAASELVHRHRDRQDDKKHHLCDACLKVNAEFVVTYAEMASYTFMCHSCMEDYERRGTWTVVESHRYEDDLRFWT